MRLCKLIGSAGQVRVGRLEGDRVFLLPPDTGSLADLLAAADPRVWIARLPATETIPLREARLLAPIDRQEVWAAGVTYTRSRQARMDESRHAADFYDQVYTADRPELFFKATPHRVVGPDQPIRIRRDSRWSVPEPELTLALSPTLKIVGYTIGNDMSARDIEGENPLYLPQAKVYNHCAALGPVITLADDFPTREPAVITLVIERHGAEFFRGQTSLAAMHRSSEELVDWLARENSFPNGAFLMTGTGIVPPNEMSLQSGDVVSITIDGIGTLRNPVVQA